MMTTVTGERVWRTSAAARGAASLLLLFTTGIRVLMATGLVQAVPGGTAGLLSGIGLEVGVAFGVWLFAFRPRISLSDRAVTVVNPFRTRVLALDHLAPRVEAGSAGLAIVELSENEMRTTVGWAVQKSNFAKWTGRRVRADEASAEISAAVRRVQPNSAPDQSI